MSVVINGTSGITTPGLDASGTNKFAATVGVGGATPAASGAGITFPATASASSDANTLDDYEEGTFTPTITGSSVAGTPVNGEGFYTKIGRVVYVSIRFENVAPPSGGSGNIKCNNLPFVVATSLTSYSYAGIGLIYFASGSSIANVCPVIRAEEGNTFFRIQYLSNINADATNLTIANMGASSNYIRVTFFYFN